MANFWVSLTLGLINIGLSYRQDNDWFFWTGIVLLIMAAFDLYETTYEEYDDGRLLRTALHAEQLGKRRKLSLSTFSSLWTL